MRRVAAAVILAAVLAGCKKEEKVAAAPPAPGTTEWKIQNAMSAGPEYVVGGAKLLEYVPNDTAMPVLRQGTNDWTCFTDDPSTPANDPSCADDEAMKWHDAWMKHQPPHLTGMGLIYTLQGCQLPSTADPFKLRPDSAQAWVDVPPSIFVMMPDARAYRGLPTAPAPGKAWVLYAGTPYAMLVVPAAMPGAQVPAAAAAPQPQ